MTKDPYAEIRQACAQANRQLPTSGLVDLTFGNVSVCDPQRKVFAIKPSGIGYDALQAGDMVIVSIETGEVVDGNHRPSSDTPTHRRLYQAFPNVYSVVHTHSRKAVAWAQAGREIPCLGTTHADYFYGSVPLTREMTPEEIAESYEWNTAEVIIERFRNVDPDQMPAVLVRGHGPFSWGATPEKALEHAVALEVVADMAFSSLQIHLDATPLPAHLRDKHFFRKHGPGAYYGQP